MKTETMIVKSLDKPLSPFAKFHQSLKGIDVYDHDGNQVPKFELWERHGQSVNDETESIMNLIHCSYRYDTKRKEEIEKHFKTNKNQKP